MLARDNPFRIEQVLKIRYQMDAGAFELLLQRWQEHGYRGALVGPEGSGKTTLLEDIAAYLRAQGGRVRWLQFHRHEPNQNHQQITTLASQQVDQEVLLVDGAEQLSWIRWRKLVRTVPPGGRILITSHKPGLLPTIWECSTSPELLIRLVRELSPHSDLSPADLRQIYLRHSGNVRDALRELYDRCATVD